MKRDEYPALIIGTSMIVIVMINYWRVNVNINIMIERIIKLFKEVMP